ncbi:MAG: EscU/YscU/HrcU family type III secretion system export apparatus switch protein [Pseudomonadota bacterium]
MSANQDDSRRTEQPTGKRRQEFRRRGEIAYSRDATAAGALLGGITAAIAMGGSTAEALRALSRATLGSLDSPLASVVPSVSQALVLGCMPTALGAVAGALAIGGIQTGWPPLFRFPRPSFGRFFSSSSLKNMLAPKAIAGRTIYEAAKFAVVALAAALAIRGEIERYRNAPAFESGELLQQLVQSVSRLARWTALALAVLAAIHYIKTRRAYNARLRMTREEIREEVKEQEGDPKIKGRRRRRMREIARQRVATLVPKADVVVVNPTHYAVALRYSAAHERAPRVLAKGRGLVAQRIRAIARRASVPIVSEPPLARALFKLVPEGREIPAALYRAVATVLAYVYRLRRRTA